MICIRMANTQGQTIPFYEILEKIINSTTEDAINLVKGLNANRWKDAFFTSYIEKLPSVTVLYKRSAPYGRYPPLEGQSLVVKDPRMKGEFSNVFTNTEGPFVYKVLDTSGYRQHALPYLYTSFKEIVIQALLQSDPTHGRFICKLHGVFIASGREIILKLEGLPITYENHLLTKVIEMKYNRQAMVKNSLRIKDDLIKLFTILKHFRDTYEYRHYDLHFNNLMVDASGEFKLIDFGYESYAKIDGVDIGRLGIGEPDVYRFIRTMRPKIKPLPLIYEFRTLLEKMEEESRDPKIPLDKFIDDLSKYTVSEGGKRKTRRLRKIRRSRKLF